MLGSVLLSLFVCIGAASYPRELGPVTKNLSVWTPIRFAINYTNLNVSPATLTTVKDVFSGVANFYQKTLSVHPYLAKIPLWGLNKTCNGLKFSDADANPGVAADFIIYVGNTNTGVEIGTQDVCLIDQDVGNPIASGFWLNKDFLEVANKTEIYNGVMYLFGQALGFGSDAYKNARKNGWQLYADSELFRSANDSSGNPQTAVITPTVVSRAAQAFNSKYVGVPITSKPRTIEWDSRALAYDLMSNAPLSEKLALTFISLAWLQDLGWYSVNFTMGVNPILGYGNLGFLDIPCVDANGVPAFPDFCDMRVTEAVCDSSQMGKAFCSKPDFMGGCPLAGYEVTGSCKEPRNGLNSFDLEEFCPECFCFTGTHSRSGGPVPNRAICHRVVCSQTGATVKVGGASVACPAAGGYVQVQQVSGILYCPPYSALCPSYACPSNCNGFGLCAQGKCICDTLYYGDDCGSKLPNAAKVLAPVNVATDCVANAQIVNKKCECKPGFYYEYQSRSCLSCAPNCGTCNIVANWCTSCPANSNSNILAPAGTECVCSTGFFRNDQTGKCEACDEKCQSCEKGAGNCLSCKSSYLMQPNGQCTCPWGMYQDATVTPKVCKACSAGCDACSSATTCTQCSATYQFVTGACKCPTGQFADPVSKLCRPCYSSCLECSGTPNNCLKCSAGQVVDKTLKVCVSTAIAKVLWWNLTDSAWLSVAGFPFECVKEWASRDFCKPLVKRGAWFDSSPGYIQLMPNKLSPSPFILPSTFLFSMWVRPDDAGRSRCILSKTLLGKTETPILTFCISWTNTVYLTARVKSLDPATLGNESYIRIETIIPIQFDKWAPVKFKFEAFNDYLGRPGTMATILIDTMAYQQTFFPTVFFEDIQDMSDQRFIIGGEWRNGLVQNRFMGYMSEMAIIPSGLGTYPAVPACGCGKCTGYSVCLSDCGITETDAPSNTCAQSQTRNLLSDPSSF